VDLQICLAGVITEAILIEIKSSDRMDKVNLAGTLQLMNEFPNYRKHVSSQDPLSRKSERNLTFLHWHNGIRDIFEI
jgi:hypothetical protein